MVVRRRDADADGNTEQSRVVKRRESRWGRVMWKVSLIMRAPRVKPGLAEKKVRTDGWMSEGERKRESREAR